ncbi:MAG: choice-of-anchor D domain-containing protein [Verrucomicrobia bacterium]|nr:choice-of-anchor D domain-containing protein [Verrucomicrobiota bacterium]
MRNSLSQLIQWHNFCAICLCSCLAIELQAAPLPTTNSVVSASLNSAGGSASSTAYSEVGELDMLAGASASALYAESSGLIGGEQGYADIAVGELADGSSSVNFGTVNAGATQSVKTFTISNPGSGFLGSFSVTKDGAAAEDFKISTLSGTGLLAGPDTITFTVTFAPKKSGAKTAALHIVSNVLGPKNSFDIALTGTAQSLFELWAADKSLPLDPNANGGQNLISFAFGLEPGDRGALEHPGDFAGVDPVVDPGTPIVKFEPTTNGLDFRALFTRRKDYLQAGIVYTPQFSADLSFWANSMAIPTVIADDGVNQIVTVPYPASVGKKKARFFRVSVTAAP